MFVSKNGESKNRIVGKGTMLNTLTSNTVNRISEDKKNSGFLTVDVNKMTGDDVIGIVDRLAVVPATVFPGQNWDLEICVVRINGDGVQRIFLIRVVPLKGDRRSALNATDKIEMTSFSDIRQVWDDQQFRVGERHCGEERDR